MKVITQIKRNKKLLFIIGIIISVILGGRDTNYWGLKDKSGEQILREIESGIVEPFQVFVTSNQEQEISDIILKKPQQYSTKQKALISKKSGGTILMEIEKGLIKHNEVILNATQRKEIIGLINANPENYSTSQKLLVKEKTGEEILKNVGLGIRNPKSIKLTIKQRKEIEQLISNDSMLYNENQKSLVK